MPPTRKKPPMAIANFILCVAAIKLARTAPIKVPRACARKGKIKFSGPNKWIEAARLSMLVTSTPFGGGDDSTSQH